MEICILSIGKINSPWIREALKLFEDRIPHYTKFSTIIIPDIKNARNLSKDALKEEETKAVISNLSPSDFVALLDEKGKEFTSVEWAEWFRKQMNAGKKRLVLIIGGPFGFAPALYQRADCLVALSKMTFTHEMAKLILTEQTYRAMTILKGEPYHHV